MNMKGNSAISILFLLLVTLVFIVPPKCEAGLSVWTEKTPMPTARKGLAIGVVNDKIYAIGGNTGSQQTTKNEEYSPSLDSWTTMLPMPTARERFATGVVNNRIYAIGGWKAGSGVLNTVEEYDPARNTWNTTKSPMPTARYGLAVGVVNGKIYAIGGYTGAGLLLNTVEEYDPTIDTWLSRTPMPTKRQDLAIGVVDGKVYAIGGYDRYQESDTNEMYNPENDSWTSRPPMPTPRSGLAIGVVNGKVYAIGGGLTPKSITEVYDPKTNTWDIITPMPTARVWVAVAVSTDKIYAIGGFALDASSKNEELTVVAHPVADFTYVPTAPLVGLPVTFNASTSYDPDGFLVSYMWDFGDGNSTILSVPTITHVYTTQNTYIVNLAVTDNDALNDSISKSILVLKDSTPPTITLISPENKTYSIASVPLEFTVNEATSWMTYGLDDGANATITGNTSLPILSDGWHSVVVYANDTSGNMGASSIVHFTVDTIAPNITSITQIPLPNNVLPIDEVKINATIIDNLSRTKQATLNYTYTNNTGTWTQSIIMTNIDGSIWNAMIPAFPYGTNVTYVITTEDNAGNIVNSESLGYECKYQVVPEFPSHLVVTMFMMATLLAAIAYRKKRIGIR